jgi:mannose-6-phosphate isomerase-like protein (cupin superfamily)
MPRIAFLLLFTLIIACASSGPVVKTDQQQLPRDYETYIPVLPVMPEVIGPNHMPWVTVDRHLRRKVYFNDRQTLVLNEWSKGDQKADASLQYHTHELSGYVLDGNLMVTIDKQTQGVGPGGVFIIPSNVHYSLLPLSPKAVYLTVFTPTRDDFRRTPPSVRFDENDIKSLVYQWFSHLDRMADAGKLMPFLATQGLTMRFPGVLFKSRDDFQAWYLAQMKKMKATTYKVEQLQVEIDKNNNYIAKMSVSRQAATILDEDRSYRSRQTWVLTDHGGAYPVITYMDVEESNDPR